MSDKNSDKSKRETEAHELRRDVRREEAGQRRQQRKDAREARHLEHEEKHETSELIDLSNRLEKPGGPQRRPGLRQSDRRRIAGDGGDRRIREDPASWR